MYCTQCGAELTEQARFCTACGAPVDDNAPKEDSNVEDPEQRNTETGKTEDGVFSFEDCSAEEPSADKKASFSEALDSSKMKSKRRIPFIALVALALALLSGIAYAAYQVYTHYIAPAQQEATVENAIQTAIENTVEAAVETIEIERPQPEESEESEETETRASPDHTDIETEVSEDVQSQSESEAAIAAYEEVLNQYREAKNIGLDAALSAWGAGSLQLININAIQDNPDLSSFGYCYADLDANGIPELLIGSDSEDLGYQTTYANYVWHGYSFQNDSLIPFLQGWSRNTYTLCEENVFFSHGSGGFDIGGNGYYVLEGTALTPIETISWEPQTEDTRGEGGMYSIKHYNKGSVEETIVPFEEIPHTGFNTTYAERDDIDWLAL